MPEETSHPPPVAEKIVETKETIRATTDEAALATVTPPAVILADDRARKWLAGIVVLQFVAIVGSIIYTQTKISDTQMILGAEITFMSGVLNYYFGSSSGSTAKDINIRNGK